MGFACPFRDVTDFAEVFDVRRTRQKNFRLGQ